MHGMQDFMTLKFDAMHACHAILLHNIGNESFRVEHTALVLRVASKTLAVAKAV